MVNYETIRDTFVIFLGEYYSEVAENDLDDGFVPHSAMGQLLTLLVEAEATDADPCNRIISLVTELAENGDEDCGNVVDVSFFENMDRRSEQQREVIRSRFSPSMCTRMDQTLKDFGIE